MASRALSPARPWKPRTRASAMMRLSSTSSPAPSMPRPQRWSRATSTIGAKFQSIPAAVASTAATRAVRSASSGSKLPASARGIGKTVRKPWITSAAKISGILRRLFSVAITCICRAISAPLPLNTPPIRPRRTSSICWRKFAREGDVGLSALAAPPAQAAAISVTWPAFSSTVILAISASMSLEALPPSPICAISARAGDAAHAATAPAPINSARLDTEVRGGMAFS